MVLSRSVTARGKGPSAGTASSSLGSAQIPSAGHAPITPSPPEGSPVTPAQTPPLPDDHFTGWEGGADPTTWLGEFDAAGLWHLPRAVRWFTLGGSRDANPKMSDNGGTQPSAHISIPGRGLSATHCLLERRADRLRVYDQHSPNGTFIRGRRIEVADLNPGDTFPPNPVTLVAMNDEMYQNRSLLYEIIGSGFRPSPDTVMVEAATGSGPILITGERGCGHERLAQAIHNMSLRRGQKLVELDTNDRGAQVAIAKQASQARTTVVLSLAPKAAPIDPLLSSMLWSTSFGVRVIVLARTEKIARDSLGEDLVGQMRHVHLRQLAYRTVEIDQLLDGMLAEKQAPFRTADLTRENQAALRTHSWPKNLAELRQLAGALVAHAASGNLRAAGEREGRSHSALGRDFQRVGLTFPLFRHG